MKKTIAGILLIVISIGFLVYWENYGREKFTYVQILTINRNVYENEIISKDMLTLKSVSQANRNSYRIGDYDDLIGKKAGQFIPEGAELYSNFFEDDDLVPDENKGEFILSVPKSWLLSVPQTIKRGDKVVFTFEGNEILETTVVYVKDSSNNEVTSGDERLDVSSQISIIEVITSEKELNTLYNLIYDGEGKERGKFVLLYR